MKGALEFCVLSDEVVQVLPFPPRTIVEEIPEIEWGSTEKEHTAETQHRWIRERAKLSC